MVELAKVTALVKWSRAFHRCSGTADGHVPPARRGRTLARTRHLSLLMPLDPPSL